MMLRRALLLLAVSSLSCRKDAPVAPVTPALPAPKPPPKVPPQVVTLPGVRSATRCADVTAAFVEPAEADTPGPGVLEFRFADGGVLRPKSEAAPFHLSAEVFSPDCNWVALDMGDSGPYHLFPTRMLAGYLAGGFPPAVVQAPVADGGSAQVHSDLRWVADDEVEFFGACCGGVEVFRAKVSAPSRVTRVHFAPEAPHGLTRTPDGGYALVAPR
jgi:hypothetical protein